MSDKFYNYQQMMLFQDDGWIPKGRDALSLANAAVIKAKNAVPEHIRHEFRSFIRYHEGGYLWGYILKG